MNNKNIVKTFIFLVTIALFATKTYAVEEEQSIQTYSMPTVSITKQVSNVDSTVYDGMSGRHSGMHTVYMFETNGTDADYDFLITAKTAIVGETVNGFTNNGDLIFSRLNADSSDVSTHPTAADHYNVTLGRKSNQNIIAYPVRIYLNADNPMQYSFKNSYKDYENCYQILIGNNSTGTVKFEILETPVEGSYGVAMDQAGSYQSVVTFSAITK